MDEAEDTPKLFSPLGSEAGENRTVDQKVAAEELHAAAKQASKAGLSTWQMFAIIKQAHKGEALNLEKVFEFPYGGWDQLDDAVGEARVEQTSSSGCTTEMVDKTERELLENLGALSTREDDLEHASSFNYSGLISRRLGNIEFDLELRKLEDQWDAEVEAGRSGVSGEKVVDIHDQGKSGEK